MSHPPQPGPTAQRIVLIAILVAIVVGVGHWGVRTLRARSGMARASSVIAGRGGKLYMGEKDGADAPDIPRPPESRRIGVIAAQGTTGNLSLHYLTFRTPTEVVEFYRNQMPVLGWRALPAPGPSRETDMGHLLFYSNPAGNSCIITITETPDGTGVTIMKLKREELR